VDPSWCIAPGAVSGRGLGAEPVRRIGRPLNLAIVLGGSNQRT